MSQFMHSRLQTLTPYTPGEQPKEAVRIKLNTNESPYPPAPGVLDAVNADAAKKLRLYSDPALRALKEAIASHCRVSPENVFAGNGSDECLNFAFLSFCENGCAFPDITYGFYSVFAALYGLDVTTVPLLDDFSVDTDALASCNRTVFLANPNAPTGLALPLKEIEKIAAANAGHVVVVDEAYVDFGAESAVGLTKEYDNLLVVQTFSKSRSLAGARIGFAIGNEALIADLETIKYSTNPYNVNRLSEACGVAAIRDQSYFEKRRGEIIETRAYAAGEFAKRGFTFPDSKANFLFVKKEGTDGRALNLALREKGILVRHFDGPRINDYNRVTIGTREDMDALFAALDEILR